MSLRTAPHFWTTTFLASLGLAPLAGCGSSTSDEATATSGAEGGGAGGDGSGAAAAESSVGGGSAAAGAASAAGASSGGAGTTGGASGAGARAGGSAVGGSGVGGSAVGGSGVGGSGVGGSGVGGSAGSAGAGGSATGGASGSASCSGATPVLGPDGAPTGFETCPSGVVHRTAAVACGSVVPRTDFACAYGPDAGFGGDCTTDADCTAQPNGYCSPGIQIPSCFCSYGCLTDDDCADGTICLCGSPVGRCVPSDCTTDSDCGGRACAAYEQNPYCGGTAYACQTALDECQTDADCGGGACTIETDHRVCSTAICAIGRPFLVVGETRLAPTTKREDWAVGERPDVSALTPELREALGRHWARVAQMEHASVAAFARLSLQLLSLGAPPALLEAAHRAAQDETRHAMEAFALASAYAGGALGPAPLDVQGALEGDPAEIVRTAVLEGCIGETIAALEAAEARERASDPVVRALLARVAEDETRHADLAWRFVGWALRSGTPELRAAATAALEAACRDGEAPARPAQVEADPGAAALEAHGCLDDSVRAEIRRRVVREVVEPCARALLAESPAEPPAEPLAAEAHFTGATA